MNPYPTGNKELDERIEMAGMKVRAVEYDTQGALAAVSFHGHDAKLEKIGNVWSITRTVSAGTLYFFSASDIESHIMGHLENAKKAEAEREDQFLKARTLEGLRNLRASLTP